MALSARRPRRRRRAAVLQRKGEAMKMAFIEVVRLSFVFFFYFKEPFLTPFSTVCLRRRTPSAGLALSFSIWASSLLKARAPRRERPARLRRRLSPCCFSPLAASSAGGLGAASEAAPVRPYPKTTSTQGPALHPATQHVAATISFRWLVSAVRGAAVDRRLFPAVVGYFVPSPPRSFFL